jgi:hypothetical protein
MPCLSSCTLHFVVHPAEEAIDVFTRLVRERLLEDGAFAKEYLRLLVHEIRMDKREVRITGSYAALAQAVEGNSDASWACPDLCPS